MSCGSCGATLDAHARFCPGCGAGVTKTEPASPKRIKPLEAPHGSATRIASDRPESMPIKRYQSRPPGVRWTPSEDLAPVPRAPTPAPTPTPPHVGQMSPPPKFGKGGLWAVAAMLLVGGGATAAVLLTYNGGDDQKVAASDVDDGDNRYVRYVDPKFGYVLEFPADTPEPQKTGDGAVVSTGMLGNAFTLIAAVGVPVQQPLSSDELEAQAHSFADGLGGKAIEIKRYRVLGRRTWGGIYENGDGLRVEAVLYPANGYILVVSIGTQTRDFADSESFRRDFFENRVQLK